MPDPIRLDGLLMNAVQTAANGVVNAETVFRFAQSGDRVRASYAGGRVEHGELVGLVRGGHLEFCYCQRHADGSLDHGRSDCELRRSADGLVQVVEHFEWGEGRGTNVLQELRGTTRGPGPPAPR